MHSMCATVHFTSPLANGKKDGKKAAQVYRSSSVELLCTAYSRIL